MSILLFFIDGVGIGDNDPARNPFARFPSVHFRQFKPFRPAPLPLDGGVVATDTSMAMPGLPQSATGQTALLTGVNSAQQVGRHLPGFPTTSLKKILAEESIFLKLQNCGLTATFANAFSPEYFERSPRKISATTWAVKASDFPFRMITPHVWQRQAISHDLSNEFLEKLGFEVPIRTPAEAADILTSILQDVDFCLFEYFLTDMIGHAQDMTAAGKEISRLDAFLGRLLTVLDLEAHTIIVTSDHGNFEDLSVATHTTNTVPTMVWGKMKDRILPGAARIETITPTILRCLTPSDPVGQELDFT